ncbi:MAG: hypothetical protein PQJ61_00475 [Spirochaetales bacterium]|uniref:Uncharacterized protein n=1 Tax=Candidatus Thalassospirochaeta sargassi TaxID=3119039 RepID=A0AAJ1ICE4_9SPIO|nr:hypothetical protein [Spirochaetales bacterium]
MGLFKNHSSLSFPVLTYTELSGADVCLLKYRKPSGIEGSFPLTVEDELQGILRYNVQNGDLDESGWWCFWAHITFIDGRYSPGDPVEVFIGEEGEV